MPDGVRQFAELQDIDTHVDTGRKRLAQIAAQLRGNPDLEQAKRELDARQVRQRELESGQKSMEYEVDGVRSRIGLLEGRLYGGQGGPKELRSMETEIAHLKERQSRLEDDLLALMEGVEQAAGETSAQKRTTQGLETDWEAARAALLEEKRSTELKLGGWETKRQSYARSLSTPAGELYEKLKASKGGLAVARVMKNRCSGCAIELPVAIVQAARSAKDLTYCNSCGRLLVE